MVNVSAWQYIFDALIKSLIPSIPVPDPLPLSEEMNKLFSFAGLMIENIPATASESKRLTPYEIVVLMELKESISKPGHKNNNMEKAINMILRDLVTTEELNQMHTYLENAQLTTEIMADNKLSELQSRVLEQLDLALAFKALAYFPGIDDAAKQYVGVPRDRILALEGIRNAVWVIWDTIIEEGKTEGFTEGKLERAYELYMFSRYLVLEQITWAAPMMDGPSNFVEVFRKNESKWAQDDWMQDDWKYALEMWNPENYYQFSQFTRTINEFEFIRFYNDGRVLSIGDADWGSTLRMEGVFSISDNIVTINWSKANASDSSFIISENGSAIKDLVGNIPRAYELTRGLPLHISNTPLYELQNKSDQQ